MVNHKVHCDMGISYLKGRASCWRWRLLNSGSLWTKVPLRRCAVAAIQASANDKRDLP